MKLKYWERIFWEIRNKFYSFFLESFVPYCEMMENTILELDVKPGMYILDAGCGIGAFEKKILEKNIPDVKIEGVDISEKILKIARGKIPQLVENVNFKVMDLNNRLNFKEETFDAIVCINVLNFLENPLHTLLEFYRVLKKGGKIILAVPKYNFSYKNLFRAHFSKRKGFTKIREFVIFIFFVLLIFLFETLILLKEKSGKYHKFKTEDVLRLFQSLPFKKFEIKETYGGQDFLIIAEK